MSDLKSTNIAEVVAACRAGLNETVQALGRALDAVFRADVGEPTPHVANDPQLAGPGLLVLLGLGGDAALAAIPESSGLLPAWIASPDPTGASKLTTLAQELGMLLLPETLMVDDFRAVRVADLAAALAAASPHEGAQQVTLTLHTDDGRSGPMVLCTPFAAGAQAFTVVPTQTTAAAPEPVAVEEPAVAEPVVEKPREKSAGVLRRAAAAAAVEAARRPQKSLEELPPYSRSLLKVRVPVMVTLARKKQRVSQIVELGPGSIIQFSKSCEQLLELEINGHTVGEGEAVKVGEKFGLRVTGMILPGEKFKAVPSKRPA